ncbi:hypothetical protein [Limnoglobus roseus]|uniref:Uncharacterized protein n=1 Tax=Limnoglobus roseus TaxID=2598579 RepID=A0A5C1AKC7_9BACT|nr:hypothetical protein [Limnoglobus roseus]QEL19671.1 hypothetical protein PX52LOC_06750 [Limnoglobus roseus]
MRTRPSLLLGLTFVLTVLPVWAADGDKKVESQKAAATANLSKAGLKKVATVETANLLVISSLPEAKTKPLAEAAQKVFTFSRAALKLDEKEELWPGKLTVVVLADSREYTSYIRVATQQRPDGKDWFSINTRGETPTASVFVDLDGKPKDADVQATVSAIVAATLLNKKAGTNTTTGPLPEWAQIGFGKVMVARSVGGAALSDYRSKSKALLTGKKAAPVRIADVWGGVKTKDSDLAAASLVEYMLYGTEGDKFFAFVAGFKPTETVAMPTIDSALEAAGWKWDNLEVGWKVWASKQK